MIRISCLDVATLSEERCAEILNLLSEERRRRAERYLNGNDRALCIGAGYLLDCALKERGKSERDACYRFGAHGKPYLADGTFCFNLSHSGTLAVLAVGESEIGIDVEKVRPVSESLEKRVCSEREQAYLAKCGAGREEEFFRIWTAKESVMKYDGRGLLLPFREIEAIPTARGLTARFGGAELGIKEFAVRGFRGSVCAEEDCAETVQELCL